MTKEKLTVLIVDDHNLIRAGVRNALESVDIKVVGEASSKGEALAQIAHTSPNVIIVDLNLPDGNGLEIVTWCRGISKSIGIVVLTMNEESSLLLASLEAGASAYVLKTAPIDELVRAVEIAYQSPESFSAHGLQSAISQRSHGFSLSPREIQVLDYLRFGKTSAQIATSLFISETTVKSHLSHIYEKLGVKNRTEAVVIGLHHGLI
ncbi:MAG: response regulator transcription factor [Actinomycetota bacterium]